MLGEEKMLGSNRKGATSPASKKSSPETGKVRGERGGHGTGTWHGVGTGWGHGTGRARHGDMARGYWHPKVPCGSCHVLAPTHAPRAPQASSEKPKRPISAMFIFSEEKRKQLQEERPELSESELTRLLARMWNDLSEKKKVGAPPTSIPILHPLGMPPVPILLPGAQFAPLQAGGVTPWERHGASEVPVPVPLAVPAPCSLLVA